MQYARYMDSRLKNSNPTAHAANRLVLLGSPPDTVHGATLRGTDLSSLLIQGRRHIARPGAGIHSRCSGLRVQGTAISPTSAALLRAETETKLSCIVLYFLHFSNDNFRKFRTFSAGRKNSAARGAAELSDRSLRWPPVSGPWVRRGLRWKRRFLRWLPDRPIPAIRWE